jgi:hypothetical protein
MRVPVYYITLFSVAIILTSGCKKHEYVADQQQMILFQYDFRSDTQHNGFIIDGEGNVFTYNNPEKWNFPDNDLEISEEMITENTGKCDYSGIKIPEDELVRYAKVIEFIASSKVTAPKSTGTEEGTSQYICYQYSESSQKYKGQIIKTEGDITRENLNFHSKRVASWMRDIETTLSSD